jgi:hypothetical protein
MNRLHKGAEVMLSNASIVLIAYFLKCLLPKTINYNIGSCFNKLLHEGLTRDNNNLYELMLELQIEAISYQFSMTFY